MPSKKETPADAAAAAAAPEKKIVAPPYLKFLGNLDSFVSGVPQGNLQVVDAPAQVWEITPKQAVELLKSGLYIGSDEALSVGSPIGPPTEEVAVNG